MADRVPRWVIQVASSQGSQVLLVVCQHFQVPLVVCLQLLVVCPHFQAQLLLVCQLFLVHLPVSNLN